MLVKCLCVKCKKTLLYYEMEKGLVEIKCRNSKCGMINAIFCDHGNCRVVDKFDFQKKMCYNSITVNKPKT